MWDCLLVKLSRPFEWLDSKSLHSAFDCFVAPDIYWPWEFFLLIPLMPVSLFHFFFLSDYKPIAVISFSLNRIPNSILFGFSFPTEFGDYKLLHGVGKDVYFAFLRISSFHRSFITSSLYILSWCSVKDFFMYFIGVFSTWLRRLYLTFICCFWYV